MNKTYHRRVFGGRDSDWKGIDQGKHPLYKGAVNMAMNAVFSENVFKARDGQDSVDLDSTGSILSAVNSGSHVSVGAGTDLFVEVL